MAGHTSATAAATQVGHRSFQNRLHRYMNAKQITTPFRDTLMTCHIFLVSPVTSELFYPFRIGATCASSEWPGSASMGASFGPLKTAVKLCDSVTGAHQV